MSRFYLDALNFRIHGINIENMIKVVGARLLYYINKRSFSKGVTLLELLLIVLLIALLVLILVQAYNITTQRTNIERAISDIKGIEIAIEHYYITHGHQYPQSLEDLGMNLKLDPWGKPYQYLNISTLPEKGQNPLARKDKNLFPLNSDFDLYSMGPDGKTKISLNADESKDDVIRANNGSYVGLATEY